MRFQGGAEEEVRAWLCRVLLNNVGDLRQGFQTAAKRKVSREASMDDETQAANPKEILADETPSPRSKAGRREEAALVEAALAKLAEPYRQVIRLRHQDHLAFAEIGAVMNRSEQAVQKLWERAIKQLREVLGSTTP